MPFGFHYDFTELKTVRKFGKHHRHWDYNLKDAAFLYPHSSGMYLNSLVESFITVTLVAKSEKLGLLIHFKILHVSRQKDLFCDLKMHVLTGY